MRHQLHAIADAEDWNAQVEEFFGNAGRLFLIDAGRTAGQHNALRAVRQHGGEWHGTGQNLRIDLRLTDAARNQLSILRTEVEDQNSVVPEFHGWIRPYAWLQIAQTRNGRSWRIGVRRGRYQRSVGLPIHPVVGRLFRNDHVMHVAFTKTGDGLADEGGLLLKIGNGLATAIAHPRLHTAHQLVDDGRQRPLIGNTPFDAFRDQFLSWTAALSVAVSASALHSTDRSHAAIHLIRSSLVQ